MHNIIAVIVGDEDHDNGKIITTLRHATFR